MQRQDQIFGLMLRGHCRLDCLRRIEAAGTSVGGCLSIALVAAARPTTAIAVAATVTSTLRRLTSRLTLCFVVAATMT